MKGTPHRVSDGRNPDRTGATVKKAMTMITRRIGTRDRAALAGCVLALGAALALPAQAAPKTKVLIEATVSGSTVTEVLEAPAAGQVLFVQTDHLSVEGTFDKSPISGTLEYSVEVLIPSPGAPAQFLNATTQWARLDTNVGSVDQDLSWYALPVIGFECVDADPFACMQHNAVVLEFGPGTGDFAALSGNELWTMRVERTSDADGVIAGGTLTGGIGLGFKYCFDGAATSASATEGTFLTATSLALSNAVCRDEFGNTIDKDNVPGAAMTFDYSYEWSVVPPAVEDEDAVVTLHGNGDASGHSAAGAMTGVVADIHMGAYPPWATGDALMLGGSWGDLTGLYSKYQYVLVRTWNIYELEQEGDEEFPLGTWTFTEYSSTVGVLAAY